MRGAASVRKCRVAGLVALAALAILTGYMREAGIAAAFGAGRTADAYFAVLLLVTILVDLLPGAALLTSIVPALAPLALDAATAGVRRTVVTVTACILGVTTILLSAAVLHLMPVALRLISPGFDAESARSALSLAEGLVWLLPLQATVLLFTLTLNAHGRFALAAAMPALSNGIFAGVLAISGAEGERTLSVAALLGPAVAVLILGGWLCHLRLLGLRRHVPSAEVLRQIWQLARPTLLTVGIGSSTGLLMLAHMLLRREGSHFGPGGISALGYAFRIYEVPISLFANVAATLALPAISSLHGRASGDEIVNRCRQLLLWGAVLLVPAAAIAFFEAPLLVDLLFSGGQFSDADAALTADALRGFAPAILLEAAIVVSYRIFYALRRPLVPVVLSGVTLAALALALFLFGGGGVMAIAYCLSVSFAVTLATILIAWRTHVRRLHPEGS